MDFDAVYIEYANAVYRFLLGLSGNEHLAEELTQECFYRAFKNRKTYNGKCKISVWLCQIAKNLYFDYCRKKHPSPLAEDIIDDFNLEDALCDNDTAKHLHMILHELEDPYKEVFSLRVFSELSYHDIAEIFAKSESWARVTYHRAKMKIAEKYSQI